MKKAVLSLSIVAALMCLGWNAAFAADNAKPAAPPAAAPAQPAAHAPMMKELNLAFTGVNEPTKMKVAGKEVTENELKIAAAKDSSGKALSAWTGKVIRYADSGKGSELLKGHASEQISVTGMFNPRTRIVTVTSYEKVEPKAPAAAAPAPAPAAPAK